MNSVSAASGSISAQLDFATNVTNHCVPANFTLPGGGMSVTMTWPVVGKQGQRSVLEGSNSVPVQGDILQVDASGGRIQVTNISPTSPRICSTTFLAAGSVYSYFASPSSSITSQNSTAAAVLIPLVILGIAALNFFHAYTHSKLPWERFRNSWQIHVDQFGVEFLFAGTSYGGRHLRPLVHDNGFVRRPLESVHGGG